MQGPRCVSFAAGQQVLARLRGPREHLFVDFPMTCPLCKKLQALPMPSEEVVWEFPCSIVLLGPWQYYTGYCVVVARQHADELIEYDDAKLHGFFGEMIVVARAISTCFKPRKINYEL